jgi:SAM-dependent methyltransferase
VSAGVPTVWDYSGVVAAAYDRFFGPEPYSDQGFFAARIAANGGPALELACGTGRLLLPLLRDGLVVEGLDTSADMLAILRRKASALGLHPVLHQRPMQHFELPARFATVFCAINSFQILVEDTEIDAALACCFHALRPGGELVLTVTSPPDAWAGEWTERRRVTLEDGARVVIDEQTRPHPTQPRWCWDLRWRISRGDDVQELLQSFTLRDYDATDLPARLHGAGFSGVAEQRGYTGPHERDGQRIIFARRPDH